MDSETKAVLSPWIDPAELRALEGKYPQLPRSDLVQALEDYWPVRHEVESAIESALQARGA